MNKVLCFALIIICSCERNTSFSLIEKADYYVAPWGDDNNPGDFDQPWATWQYAFDNLTAGDTVYIRGGVYTPADVNYVGVLIIDTHGTKNTPICIFNYPSEIPVLDCSNVTGIGSRNGLLIQNSSNIILKGLEITNTKHSTVGEFVIGCFISRSNKITIENSKSYNHGGPGFFSIECDTLKFVNCDAFNNYDAFTEDYSGGHADGFGIKSTYVELIGCRAWNNSDDGYDFWQNEGIVVVRSCWSFNNGYDSGDGNGFKLGRTFNPAMASVQRILTNCLAVENNDAGFDENYANVKMELYNNTSFGNRYGFRNYPIGETKEPTVYKNNISFNDSNGTVYFQDTENLVHDHNSWNFLHPLSVNDFVTVNSNKMNSERQPNGSLPIIEMLNLSRNSSLIDAGVDVGLPYKGRAPDVGAFEAK